jgi:hypothetical protein
MTDCRAKDYVERFGDQSWELDALDPTVLSGMVRAAVLAVRHERQWKHDVAEEVEARRLLGVVSSRWDKLTGKL